MIVPLDQIISNEVCELRELPNTDYGKETLGIPRRTRLSVISVLTLLTDP
jgi:hypothetical protein